MARTLPIRLRTIAAAIVVIASGLIIWNAYQSIIGASDVTDATLPIIKADATPFRVVPENPGGAEIPNQGSTLYNVLDAENGDEMALDGVNIDQEPETLMEVNDSPLAGFELPEMPEQRTESLYGILDELKQDKVVEAEIVPSPEQNIEPMKADATIALKEKLQAAIEKVEEKETNKKDSHSELVSKSKPIEILKQVQGDTAIEKSFAIKPTKKPAYTKPKIIEKKVVKTDIVKPASSPRPVAKTPTKKRHYIQLASLRGEGEARTAYNKIRTDFPKLVEGLSVSFPQADLGSRGVFTRIQIGPLDTEKEARNRCASYNSTRGATCLVISR